MKGKQIIVGQEVIYAAKVGGGAIANMNDINDLVTGGIAIFTEAGALVTVANMAAALDDVKNIVIAVGNQQSAAAQKAFLTIPIPRIGTNYSKSAYTAPVKLRKFVGQDGATGALNMPTFVLADRPVALLKIINTTPGLRSMGASVEGQEIFRYSYQAVNGDTNNTMITKLIAKINADPDRIVNATVVGAQLGIQLDARDFGTTFAMSMDEALQYATKEEPEGTLGNAIAINFGIGTSDQVATLEDLYMTLRGKTQRIEFVSTHFSHPSLVISGETYNLYTMGWNGFRTSAMEGSQSVGHFEVVVALPNGTAVATSFESIIEEVFGGVYTTSMAETGV